MTSLNRAGAVLTVCHLIASVGAAAPRLSQTLPLPLGAKVAVILLRDCVIPGQEDCNGSGNVAAAIFARVLSQSQKLLASPLARPVAPSEVLSDSDAVAYAKAKGFEYVLNGEVDDYYNVAFATFRSDRAGVSIRILRTSDGQVVANASQRNKAGNYSSPDKILEGIAKKFGDALRTEATAAGSRPSQPAPSTAAAEPSALAPGEPATTRRGEGHGTFTIESIPPGAEVYVNGEFVGTTPIGEHVLQAGKQSIEIRKRGFVPWMRQLSVSAGARATVAAELEPAPAPQ